MPRQLDRNEGPRKRQRRLTAAQHVNKQSLEALKQGPAVDAAVLVQEAAPVPEEVHEVQPDPAPAPAPAAQPAAQLPHPPRDLAADSDDSEDEAASSSWDDSDSVCSDEDDASNAGVAGYQTAGPSLKVAPGKRIKWRTAILEDDLVRQNLSFRFLRVGEAVPGVARLPARRS